MTATGRPLTDDLATAAAWPNAGNDPARQNEIAARREQRWQRAAERQRRTDAIGAPLARESGPTVTSKDEAEAIAAAAPGEWAARQLADDLGAELARLGFAASVGHVVTDAGAVVVVQVDAVVAVAMVARIRQQLVRKPEARQTRLALRANALRRRREDRR